MRHSFRSVQRLRKSLRFVDVRDQFLPTFPRLQADGAKYGGLIDLHGNRKSVASVLAAHSTGGAS
jgi:hypothetical protein